METAVLLLGFVIIGVTGCIIAGRIDVFLERSRNRQEDLSENRDSVIRIACENPMMLFSFSHALNKSSKEFEGASFCFYTGSKADIQGMMDEEDIDIVLLMEEPDMENREHYGEKVSSFVPATLPEPVTGVGIEPIVNQKRAMYVLWNKRHITGKQQKALSDM